MKTRVKITNRRGYLLMFMPLHPRSDPKGYVFEHIVVAESALGSTLLKKHVVHHVDGDKLNNSNNNLVICEDQRYHMLIHARARVLSHGANPNTHGMCCACKKPLPIAAFAFNPRRYNQRSSCCRMCARNYARTYAMKQEAAQ